MAGGALEFNGLDEISRFTEKGKPYFGSQLFGICSKTVRYGHMTALVKHLCQGRTDNEPVSILEVGSWIGASAVTWAKAIEEFNQGAGPVSSVDPWAEYRRYHETGAPPDDRMNAAFGHDLPQKLFLHNIRACGVEELIIPIKSTGIEVLRSAPDDSFDIIYLDEDRMCDNVIVDIELTKTKVKIGGYITGDDLNLQAHEVDRSEIFAAIEKNIEMFANSSSVIISRGCPR